MALSKEFVDESEDENRAEKPLPSKKAKTEVAAKKKVKKELKEEVDEKSSVASDKETEESEEDKAATDGSSGKNSDGYPYFLVHSYS